MIWLTFSVQSLSHVQLFETPWTAAHQASLSIANSQSLLKLMSIESVMPSNRLILSSPSPPALNLSQHQGLFKWVTLRIRWPKHWSFSFSISPSNEYLGLTDVIFLQSKGLLRVFSSTTVQKYSSVFSLLYGPTLTSIREYWKNHGFDYMDLCQQSNECLCILMCCLGWS